MAHWSARRRSGTYIEAEDLLHALIRQDRGEFPAISAEVFRGAPQTRKATRPVDMPVSASLKKVLAWVAKAHEDDTKTIEPLDLLAGIVEDRESRLAQLLLVHGITRQGVDAALNSEL